MRVLFVAHSYPRHADDVAGSFLLRLARALRDHAEIETHVLAPSAPGLPPSDTIGGIPVARVRYAPRAWETLAYEGTMADAVRRSWRARAALLGMIGATAAATRAAVRRHRIDVVHAHWWFPGALAAAIPGGTAGRPLVVTSHGSDIRLAVSSPPARALFARVIGRAAAMTAVSSWLCGQAESMAPTCGCIVAPMPVEADLFSPPPSDAGRAGLLFVGRLTAQKGVDHLLRALRVGRGTWRLTIVGDGPERPALESLASELGVADRVDWVGARPPRELPAFYRAARALVVPSREEGLGLVAVEAHLSGTPVVAFASGGLVDVVHDRVDGRLVPPGDDAALADAIDALLADPEEASRLGAAGRAAALARFSPAGVAARYAEIYARVQARGRA